jgi:hypothetical protein
LERENGRMSKGGKGWEGVERKVEGRVKNGSGSI